jgi:hypothetical protein
MAASKLAVAVWIGSAAVLTTGTSAAVYSLAGSNSSTTSAAAKTTPTPSPTSPFTGGGSTVTTAAAKPTPTATTTPNGNGQGNNGNGAGNGGSTGSPSNSHPVTLTGSVTGQPGPGVTAQLNITIDNSKNQAIVVRTVTATVTSVTSGTQAGKPQCRTSWYSIAPFSGSLPIAAGAKGAVPLTVTFTNEPAINQDNCRGATYSFSFNATADQA